MSGKFSDLIYYFLRKIYRAYKKGKARRELKKFYKRTIDSETTCIDIGAHIGTMTELMLHARKVIAVEPQKEICGMLEQKFKKNLNVSIINCAVSNENGKITLYIDRTVSSTATVSQEFFEEKRHKYQEAREVTATTLEKIFCDNNLTEKEPIYLKIDAENYEDKILSTMPFLPNNLSFEIHTNKKQKMLACLKILDDFGEHYLCNILPHNESFVFKEFVPAWRAVEHVFSQKGVFVIDFFIQKILEC